MLEQTGMVSSEKGTYYYSSDKTNNTRKVEVDYDGDGKIDSTSLFYEDENGKTIKGLYDDDGDGKYDDVALFEYDDEGKLKTRYDGTVDYSYDLNDNGEYEDINHDGKIDENDKVKHENFDKYVDFSYDEEGNKTKQENELTGWKKLSVKKKSINIEKNSLNLGLMNALKALKAKLTK